MRERVAAAVLFSQPASKPSTRGLQIELPQMIRTTTVLAPVLLVEDDDNDVFLMRRAFTLAAVRHPLFVAHDAEHAIELLKEASNFLSLLITDINLPGLNGFDLLLWLQARPQFRGTPKLVISSSVSEEDLAKSLLSGAAGYYAKPNGISALVAFVREWKETYLENAACTSALGDYGI